MYQREMEKTEEQNFNFKRGEFLIFINQLVQSGSLRGNCEGWKIVTGIV